MFLITHEYMRNQWTFTWKKCDGHFHSFSMPVFRVFSLESLILNFLLQLVQESVLCAHTEITDGEETHLFQDEFSRELKLKGCVTEEILKSQRRDLHDVAYVEAVDPFALIQISKDVLHVWLTTIVKVLAWLSGSMIAWWSTWLLVGSRRCNITSSSRWNISSAAFGELQWPSYVNTSFCVCTIVLNCHFLLNFNQNRQQLDRCLFQQREPLVAYYTDIIQILPFLLLGQLCHIKLTLILALIYQIVSNLNGTVWVEYCLLVLVYLTQESTYLHMCFAFVFQHFQAERWLLWIAEVLLEVITIKMVDACFQTDGALFQNA